MVNSGLARPLSLALDGGGNLYIANVNSGTIAKVTPGGTTSTFASGFSNGGIDDLLKAARQEPDPAKRLGLYQDAERRIMDLVPIIPIAQFQTQSVIGARVAGLVVNPLGTFDAAAVWLTH